MKFVIPQPPADAAIIYLLRHGATANNRAQPPKLQGRRSDFPLDEVGLAQADAAGRCLAAVPLAAVYASPMRRALQTAEAIAGVQRLPVIADAGLTEVDVGEWEGLTWDEVEKLHPAERKAFRENPAHCPYLGGENFAMVQARVVPAFAAIADRHLGQSIAIVAHNVVNRCLLTWAMHTPLETARQIPQHNGGINVLRYKSCSTLAPASEAQQGERVAAQQPGEGASRGSSFFASKRFESDPGECKALSINMIWHLPIWE